MPPSGSTPYKIVAAYGGDDNFAANILAPLSIDVTVGKAITSGVITGIDPNPLDLGQLATYTFQLTVPAKAGAVVPPGGTVTFIATRGAATVALGSPVGLTPVPNTNNTLYTAQVTGGSTLTATLPANPPAWTITATYSGDTNYLNTSATGSQDVNPGSAALSLDLTNPVNLGYGNVAFPNDAIYTVTLTGPARRNGIIHHRHHHGHDTRQHIDRQFHNQAPVSLFIQFPLSA